MFGRYFDEFKVGDVYQHEPARTITATEIALLRWLLRGKQEAFTGRVVSVQEVPLWFAFSLCLGLTGRDISARASGNLWFRDVVYHHPIYVGQTVRAETTVLATPEYNNEQFGLVSVESRLYDENDRQVLSFQRCCIIPRRV